SVGVVGGGFMGSGIAESVAVVGLPVVVRDIDDKAIDAARGRIETSLARAVKRGKIRDPAEVLERIELTTDLAAMRDLDLVVEAAPEDERLKVEIFAALTKVVREDAVLASNTSSIPIAELAKEVERPDRVLGLHFF